MLEPRRVHLCDFPSQFNALSSPQNHHHHHQHQHQHQHQHDHHDHHDHYDHDHHHDHDHHRRRRPPPHHHHNHVPSWLSELPHPTAVQHKISASSWSVSYASGPKLAHLSWSRPLGKRQSWGYIPIFRHNTPHFMTKQRFPSPQVCKTSKATPSVSYTVVLVYNMRMAIKCGSCVFAMSLTYADVGTKITINPGWETVLPPFRICLCKNDVVIMTLNILY